MKPPVATDTHNPTEQSHRRKLIPMLVVVYLIALITWNIASFMLPSSNGRTAVAFPSAGFRGGYLEYVASTPPSAHDFYIYESIRRIFPGGHLIGFDRNAIAFGTHTFGGLMKQSVTPYDPNLTEDETRVLWERALTQRPPAQGIPATVIVATLPVREHDGVIVLTGIDGERFFVRGSLAPERYARIVNDH